MTESHKIAIRGFKMNHIPEEVTKKICDFISDNLSMLFNRVASSNEDWVFMDMITYDNEKYVLAYYSPRGSPMAVRVFYNNPSIKYLIDKSKEELSKEKDSIEFKINLLITLTPTI